MVFVVEEFHDSFDSVARLLRFSLAKQVVGYFPVDSAAERFGFLYKFSVLVIHCSIVFTGRAAGLEPALGMVKLSEKPCSSAIELRPLFALSCAGIET